MSEKISFWVLYSSEEKKAYEVGRRAAFTKASSLTYGKGYRHELIERAFKRGYDDELVAHEPEVRWDVNEWNLTLESMVPQLRKLEDIGRSLPGDHGVRIRKLARRLSIDISDSFIDN